MKTNREVRYLSILHTPDKLATEKCNSSSCTRFMSICRQWCRSCNTQQSIQLIFTWSSARLCCVLKSSSVIRRKRQAPLSRNSKHNPTSSLSRTNEPLGFCAQLPDSRGLICCWLWRWRQLGRWSAHGKAQPQQSPPGASGLRSRNLDFCSEFPAIVPWTSFKTNRKMRFHAQMRPSSTNGTTPR